MELCGASPNILEVEFFDEVGTGLGPTLEFYSLVSKEFALKQYKMWRDSESNPTSKYVDDPRGLFPAALSHAKLESANGKKILQLFKTLGTFVARSLLDSRIIDININAVFFQLAAARPQDPRASLDTLAQVDPQLSASLRALEDGDGISFEELELDFTLPGDASVELVAGGSEKRVTKDNVTDYVEAVVSFSLYDGVEAQIEAFRDGFSEVFPFSALQAFYPEELSNLVGQSEEDWSYKTIYDAVKADHGYTKESQTVKDLVEILSLLSKEERRAFLQFMTGSPKLPTGGFRALNPVFTVVWKQTEDSTHGRDAYLPSVMTCANYLKIPNYSSKEVLRERLMTAVHEGSGAFHLS
jgi:E3 ubiquitin-protein ligase TRIP12